jgi:putative oxidoreductase
MKYSKYLPFVGRVLLGAPFLMSGLSKLAAHGSVVGSITAAGLPLAPLGYIIAVIVEAGGGTSLMIGFRARFAALVLAVFSLATAVFFHRNFADQNTMIHFLKNVMMAGGLLQIVHFGAGAVSLYARSSR